ncbi:MAG: hypothetical protein BMS9Abin36_0673 [Gammaproteobacteria bacterium]|nr:MAG: hypothetical protein BMS9Abin36_0673 [Gammaproteobacteria bacterium]
MSEHRDSLGNSALVRTGEVQRMAAGTGITHSELNASGSEPVDFFRSGYTPTLTAWYRHMDNDKLIMRRNKQFPVPGPRQWHRFAQPVAGRYAVFYRTGAGSEPSVSTEGQRKVYVHVTAGNLQLNSHVLRHGDGAYIDNEHLLNFSGITTGEALFFDLPGTYP